MISVEPREPKAVSIAKLHAPTFEPVHTPIGLGSKPTMHRAKSLGFSGSIRFQKDASLVSF
jgi:hypothetical protein